MTCTGIHTHAMLTKQLHAFGEGFIVGCNHTAIAGADDLSGVKRETHQIGVRAYFFAFVRRTCCAGRVLNQHQIVLVAQRSKSVNICRHPDLMHKQNGFGL